MGSLNIFNFPAKKLTHASFLFVHSVSNICSVVANFPAKRLRKKYGAQKYACADFFFFFTYCVYTLLSIFSIKFIFIFLLFSCVRTVSTRKVVNTQYTTCVSFDKSFYLFQFSSKYKLIR